MFPGEVWAAEGLRFLHTDHLGSVAAVSDENGEKVGEERYAPYGEYDKTYRTYRTYTSYKFTGQERDGETNLYNYNARLYNPRLASFVAADKLAGLPAGKAGTSLNMAGPATTNRFAYGRNNPLLFTDPSGQAALPAFTDGGGKERDCRVSQWRCQVAGWWTRLAGRGARFVAGRDLPFIDYLAELDVEAVENIGGVISGEVAPMKGLTTAYFNVGMEFATIYTTVYSAGIAGQLAKTLLLPPLLRLQQAYRDYQGLPGIRPGLRYEEFFIGLRPEALGDAYQIGNRWRALAGPLRYLQKAVEQSNINQGVRAYNQVVAVNQAYRSGAAVSVSASQLSGPVSEEVFWQEAQALGINLYSEMVWMQNTQGNVYTVLRLMGPKPEDNAKLLFNIIVNSGR